MALATLGVSVSKSLNIPPIAGAIVGVLIGGIWMLITEDEQQPLQPTIADSITAITVTAALAQIYAIKYSANLNLTLYPF
jgi:hypothetical protein